MDSFVIWGMILLGGALILGLLEIFLPTAGALAVTAAAMAIGGVVCMFRADPLWGGGSLAALLVLTPALISFGMKVYPHTAFGRRLIGAPSDEEVEAQQLKELTERNRLAALVGKEGVVLSDLRPIGVIEVEGVRYDALSETVFLPAGSKVRITQAQAMQVHVRQA